MLKIRVLWKTIKSRLQSVRIYGIIKEQGTPCGIPCQFHYLEISASVSLAISSSSFVGTTHTSTLESDWETLQSLP